MTLAEQMTALKPEDFGPKPSLWRQANDGAKAAMDRALKNPEGVFAATSTKR